MATVNTSGKLEIATEASSIEAAESGLAPWNQPMETSIVANLVEACLMVRVNSHLVSL